MYIHLSVFVVECGFSSGDNFQRHFLFVGVDS